MKTYITQNNINSVRTNRFLRWKLLFYCFILGGFLHAETFTGDNVSQGTIVPSNKTFEDCGNSVYVLECIQNAYNSISLSIFKDGNLVDFFDSYTGVSRQQWGNTVYISEATSTTTDTVYYVIRKNGNAYSLSLELQKPDCSSTPSPNIEVSASGCNVNSSSFDSNTKKGEISLSGVSGVATITLTKEGELANITQSVISNPGKNAYDGDLLRIIEGSPLSLQINNTSGADGDISTSVCFDVSGNLITYSVCASEALCSVYNGFDYSNPTDVTFGGIFTSTASSSEINNGGILLNSAGLYYKTETLETGSYILSIGTINNYHYQNAKTYVASSDGNQIIGAQVSLGNSSSNPYQQLFEITEAGSYRIGVSFENLQCLSSLKLEKCTAVSSSPTISLSNCPLSGLTANIGEAGTAQTVSVSGENLTNIITITVPTGFEISTDNGTTWSSSGTLSASSINASVSVRLAATQNAGNVSGSLTFSSTNATTQTCTLSGTIVAPTITISGCPASFTANIGEAGIVQTVSVSGENLTDIITITVPTGFEISTDNGTTWSSSGTLSASSTNASVSVRLAATQNAGNVSGSLTFSSTNAMTQTCALSGTIVEVSTICVTFFNSPVDFRSTGTGGTSTLPSGWSQSNTVGHSNWCNENNYYPYIINGSSTYIQSPDITLNNGKTYKVVVSTMCSSAAPSLKIYQSSSEILSVTSGSEFTFEGSNGTYNLRIYGESSNTYIKTVEMYEICSSSPTISLSNCPLSGLTANIGEAGTAQTVSVSGENLTDIITITVPTGFEISTDNETTWSSSGTLSASSTNASVSVRLAATQSSGNISGSLTFSSTNATTQTCALSGTIVAPNVTVSSYYNCVVSNVAFDTNNLSGSFLITQNTNQYAAVTLVYTNLTINSKIINNIDQNDLILYSDNGGNGTDTLKISGKVGESHIIDFQINGDTIIFTQSQSITLIPSSLSFISVPDSPSDKQTISISSIGLSTDIAITIPSGFEISTDNGTNWTSQNSYLKQNNSTTLQVRMTARSSIDSISGTLTFSSGNTTRICLLTGKTKVQLPDGATVSLSTDLTSYCEGNSIVLTAQPSEGVSSGITYQWYLNSILMATTQTPTYTYVTSAEDNILSFSVTITDGTNSVSSTSVTATKKATGCAPETVTDEPFCDGNTANSSFENVELEAGWNGTPQCGNGTLTLNTTGSYFYNQGFNLSASAQYTVSITCTNAPSSGYIAIYTKNGDGTYSLVKSQKNDDNNANVSNPYTFSVDSDGEYYIGVVYTGYLQITNFKLEKLVSASPSIVTSVANLNEITYQCPEYSPIDSFTIIISNLSTATATLGNNSNFEISLTPDFASANKTSLTLSEGTDIIYVKLKDGLNQGNYTDEITLTGEGISPNPVVTLSGNITPFSIGITGDENLDYACGDGTLTLNASPVGEGYSFQWLRGDTANTNVATYSPLSFTSSNCDATKDYAYAVEITYGNCVVFSDPFIVYSRPDLPINASAVLNTSGSSVCSGESVTFTATLSANSLVSGDYTAEWFVNTQSAGLDTVTISSASISISKTIFISENTTVNVKFKGCSVGNEVISNDIAVSLKPSAECVFNNFYVKATGGNDSNNGSSWEYSFATIDKALEAVNLYQSTNSSSPQAYIHIAAGTYTPSTTDGYVLPSEIILYGGYPVNATVGASRNSYSPANTGGNATILKQKDNTGKTLSLSSVQHVSMIGLALEGSGNSVDVSGQAINVSGNCTGITIDSCYIHNYRRDNSWQPAICLSGNGSELSVNIKNAVIADNTSSGGTVFVGNASSSSIVNIEKTTFLNNKNASTNWDGSALFISGNSGGAYNGVVNITNSTFHNNETGSASSVIKIESSDNAVLNIRNTTITGTFARNSGTVNVSNSLILLSSGGSFSNSVNNYTSTDASAFLALFEGNGTLQNCGFTQVLIPDTTNTTVKNNVINQNIALVEGITIDQCGNERIVNATTLGAYEVSSYSVILNTSAVLLCSGENATVSATATGYKNPVFTWTKNGTILTGETGNSIIINTGGTYGVSVTENGDQSTERIDSKNIETPKTGSSLAIESSVIDYCYAFSTQLNVKDSVNSQPLSNIQWKKNGAEISGYVDSVISVSHFDIQKNAVIYSVTATACDGTVLPEKSVTFTPKGNGCGSTFFTTDTIVSFCDGRATLSLTSAEPVPSGFTYEWSYAATNEVSSFTPIEANSAEITVTQEGYYKVMVRYTENRIESHIIHVYNRNNCVVNYFVRSEDGNDTDNGKTWETAFKTINTALDSATIYHVLNQDKQIAIYIGSGAGSATDYQINNEGDRYKLKHIEIKGGFPINNTDIETSNANDTTIITKSTNTNSCFEIREGKILLSRLKFSGMSGNRVITSGDTLNNVTFEDCRFNNNKGGAVSLSSGSGGKAVFYDCIFDGNQSNTSSFNGYAINITGPYNLLISTKKTNLPEKITDNNEIISASDLNDCTKKDTMKLSLLDPNGYNSLAPNKFISNITMANGNGDKGGAIYIEGAEKAVIEYANFQSNKLTKGTHGGAVYIKDVKSVNIIGSYFIGNEIKEAESEGGALYVEHISTLNMYLCHFKENIISKGSGAAFACSSSELNIQNSYIGYNKISESGLGGGFYAYDSSLVNIFNSKFEYNKMMQGQAAGGGAYVIGAVVNINNSLFQYNCAGQRGGAFYAGGNNGTAYDPATLISISNSIFRENSVVNGDGKGGVICAQNMNIDISSSFFYRNNAREASAPLYLQNGKIKIFSSSFYDNRSTTDNQTAGALYLIDSPIEGNATPNAYLYNSTFTQNGGAQKGIVCVANAYVDIVSCTIVDNDGRRFTNGADGANIDASSSSNPNVGALFLDNGAKINLINTIISGNGTKEINVDIADSKVINFKYNTIGSNIYTVDRNTQLSTYQSASCARETASDTECTITDLSCSNINFASDSLLPLCNYSISGRFTRPFRERSDGNIPCRDYGMSINELKAYQPDLFLREELLHDAHNSIRGWRRLCLDCGAVTEDIADEFRTFQGAVEGGKGVYSGNNFAIELNRMISRCVGGYLTNPYLIISIVNSETGGYVPLDSLQNYFYVTVEQMQADSTYSVYGSYNDFSLAKISANPFTLEDFRSGFYKVTVKKKENGKIQENHSAYINIESLTSTSLLWIGVNENWSDVTNWAYCDDNGKYIKSSDITPTPCYDVHIGNTYTDENGTKLSVGNLPTINGTSGNCANIYFHPGGSLGQIHKLNYVKAFVEMEIDKSTWSISNWYMISPVLKEMFPADYTNEKILAFIRYFSIIKNNNTIVGNWSKSVYNGDIPLTQRGMGYAFKSIYIYSTDTATIKLTFPIIKQEYTYTSGTVINLNKTDKTYRFLMENEDNVFEKVSTVSIDLSERGFTIDTDAQGKPETGYIIVGNPYMSHLDMDAFYNRNQDKIEGNIKLFTKNNFPAFDAVQVIDAGAGAFIAPLQSFFIKPKANAITADNKLELIFDAETMSKTDKSSILRGGKVETDLLRIRAAISSVSSVDAVVAARSGACNGFKTGEDGQKLFSDISVIDVYTLAGNSVPSDINIINSDSLNGLMVPIEIRSKNTGTLTLTIDGAIGFLSADKISLVDSLTGENVSLFRESSFEINKETQDNIEGRFYLLFEKEESDDSFENTDTEDFADEREDIFIGGIQRGIVVDANREKILSVKVYDMASRLILSEENINASFYGHKLPLQGVNYIVKIVTDKQVLTKKVFVK